MINYFYIYASEQVETLLGDDLDGQDFRKTDLRSLNQIRL